MRYAIAALSILALTACGIGQPTCVKQAAPQLVALQGIARAWDDAFLSRTACRGRRCRPR